MYNAHTPFQLGVSIKSMAFRTMKGGCLNIYKCSNRVTTEAAALDQDCGKVGQQPLSQHNAQCSLSNLK